MTKLSLEYSVPEKFFKKHLYKGEGKKMKFYLLRRRNFYPIDL